MSRLCTNACGNAAIFDEAICHSCLEKAALQSMRNFAPAENLGCGNCGHWFKAKDFVKHLPCGKDEIDDEA